MTQSPRTLYPLAVQDGARFLARTLVIDGEMWGLFELPDGRAAAYAPHHLVTLTGEICFIGRDVDEVVTWSRLCRY
jgi:hypothetical protein